MYWSLRKKIIFKTIEGLGEAFIPDKPRPLFSLSPQGKKKIINLHKPAAIANDDYHIDIYELKEGEFSLKLSGKNLDLKPEGVVVHLKDNSGKIIGIAITDSSGEAKIRKRSTS